MALLSILVVILLVLAIANFFVGAPDGVRYNRGWFSISVLIVAILLALVQFTHIL